MQHQTQTEKKFEKVTVSKGIGDKKERRVKSWFQWNAKICKKRSPADN